MKCQTSFLEKKTKQNKNKNKKKQQQQKKQKQNKTNKQTNKTTYFNMSSVENFTQSAKRS